MGSKTKSWLALALVVAMLFGMAVPTAFAEAVRPRDIYDPNNKIGYSTAASGSIPTAVDTSSSSTASATYGDFVAGAVARDIYVGLPTTAAWAATDVFKIGNNNNKNFTFTAVTDHPNNFSVKADPQSGKVSIKPIASTTDLVKLTIMVNDLDAAKFADPQGVSKYYTGCIYLAYAPVVTADKKTVTMLSDNTTGVDVVLSANAALALPAANTAQYTFKFANAGSATAAAADNGFPFALEVASGSTDASKKLTIKLNSSYPASSGNPVLPIEGDLTIDGAAFKVGAAGSEVQAQPVTIHVKVDSKTAAGYRVNVSTTEFNGRRDTMNTTANPMTFTLNVTDEYGTQTAPSGTSVDKYTGVVVSKAVFKDGTGVTSASGLKIVSKGNNVYALEPVDNNFKSWEGTITFVPNNDSSTPYSETSTGPDANAPKVVVASPAVVSVNIEEPEMTVDVDRLEFDKASTTVILKDVQASIDGGSAFTYTNTDFKAYDLSGNLQTNNAGFVGTHLGNGKWQISVAPSSLKATGALSAGYFTLENAYDAVLGTSTISLKMDPVKVYFDVVDTTTKATVNVSPSDQVVLDLNKPTTDLTKEVTLSGVDSATAAISVSSCLPATSDYASKQISGAKIKFSGLKVGTEVFTVNGTVGGVTFTKDIEVKVINTATGKPNTLSVTPDAVELGALGSTSFELDASVLDASGTALTSVTGTYKAQLVTAKGATVAASSVVKHTTANATTEWADSTNGKFTFARQNVAAAADVKFYFVDANNANIVQPVVVHITVGSPKLTVTPDEKMNLDLTTNKSATVTIRNEKGTTLDLTGYNVTLEDSKLADGTTGAIATITNNYDASFTITASKVGTAKLKAVGTVANVAAEAHYIALTVTEAPAVDVELTAKVNPSSFKIGETAEIEYTLTPEGTEFDADTEEISFEDTTIATLDHKTFTGVAEGTAEVMVSGKVNGVDYSATATFTVLPKTAVIGDLEKLILPDGTEAKPGAANFTEIQVDGTQASVGGGYDANGNKVVITGIVSSAYRATTTGNLPAKQAVKSRSVTNKVFAADVRDGVFYYKAKSVGTWAVELQTSKGTYEFYFRNVNKAATAVDAPSTLSLHTGERIDLRSIITTTPSNANKSTLKYRVSSNGVLRVTVSGILQANTTGSAKVQILNSKKTKVLATVNVTVDSDYSGIKFASAYLFQDKNADESKVADILSAANFGNNPAATAYKMTANSSAGFQAELTTLATQIAAGGVTRDDIFTFYFSGSVAQKGIKFADGTTVTFDELATTAGRMPCQVFMIFDCDYAGSFISKGAIQNSLFKAIAKANASYAKTVGAAGNGKAKLHVLLGTNDVTGSVTLAADGTKLLTSAFVKALATTADGKLGMGGTYVTMDGLYSEVKKTATKVAMYPLTSNGDAYRIYAINPTPAAE